MSVTRLSEETLVALTTCCKQRQFGNSEEITTQGTFSSKMFFILSGCVEVHLRESSGRTTSVQVGEMSALGEIGFVTGKAANATAVATSQVECLVIDAVALRQLEQYHGSAAVEFSRYLATTIDKRLQFNRENLPASWHKKPGDIEVVRCMDAGCVKESQKIRYEVYCRELGRNSPNADHRENVLADALDEFGICFLAVQQSKVVGTARVNLARNSDIGYLNELYGISNSINHPAATAIITKYAILKTARSGSVYAKLLGAIISYIADCEIEEVYMDAIPSIAMFYKKLGFEQCEEVFMHPENGLSIPMKLNSKSYFSEKATRLRQRIFAKLGLDV